MIKHDYTLKLINIYSSNRRRYLVSYSIHLRLYKHENYSDITRSSFVEFVGTPSGEQ